MSYQLSKIKLGEKKYTPTNRQNRLLGKEKEERGKNKGKRELKPKNVNPIKAVATI